MQYNPGGVSLQIGQAADLQVPAAPAKAAIKDAANRGAANDPPKPEEKKPVDGFPEIFKEVFKDILPSPIFQGISDDDIVGFFTPDQQHAIKEFADSKLIPPHLFHGKKGKATLAQRILMAGVILSTGHNEHGRPGDEPNKGKGKPRATCCGHHAHWIWTYAGANPCASSAQICQDYPSAVSGPNGAIFFGGAKYKQLSFNRQKGDYDVQPGDWLYVCYDKKEDPDHKFKSVGDHSVIFSHWKSPGQGVFFSQRFNEDYTKGYPNWSPLGGCDRHEAGVYPQHPNGPFFVSVVMRADDSDFNILRTMDEKKAAKQNAAWLSKNKLDPDKVHPQLVKRAREMLKTYSDPAALTEFLNGADVGSQNLEKTKNYRLQARVCLAPEEAYKSLDPVQIELIQKIIDDAEKAKGSDDEKMASITRLYALMQRLRMRWDSNGLGMADNINGMMEKDFRYPSGSKTVVWELLGFKDKKAASDALWG